MSPHPNRRLVLKAGAAVTASAGLGAIAGCQSMSDRPAPTPAAMLAMSSSDVVAAIRSGRMSAESYVVASLDRAERLSDLNAFISLDRAGATAQAKRIDDMRRRGASLPPLAGLPIVVKDNINSRDLPTTGGTAALRNVQPRANAPVLQQLVDAGAIVLGKTNLHELAFGVTSTNLSAFAGPVKNPYDRTRIPGGSSGGTAVAIAARIVPSGLGTDTGGSTRIPAALCGIAGLRPSVGNGGTQRRYNGAGMVPISHTRDTIGPMGRSVADVALLDAVITGGAPATAALLNGVRIGVPATFWGGLERQVDTVVAEARTRLAAVGVVFVDVDLAGLADLNGKVSFPIALHEPIADIPAYLAATGVSGIDIARIAQQIASPDVKGAFGDIQGDAMAAGYNDAIRVFRPQLQALYAQYFRANRLDAMLFPTTVAAAVPIDTVNGSGKFSIDGGPPVETFGTFIRNTDPGGNAGIPGLSFPAGATASGLPVGLELDGPLGSDRRLLSIALAMEAVLDKLPPPAL